MRRVWILLLASAGVLAAHLPHRAHAQSIWMTREGRDVSMIEFLHPSEDFVDTDTFNGAYFLSGRVRISPSLTFVDQVPFASHHAVRTFYDYQLNGFVTGDVKESGVGNIYLGVEGTRPESRIFGEAGLRLPLASGEKLFAADQGVIADVRRSQAFFPKTISFEGAVNFVSEAASPLTYRLRLNPILEYDRNSSSSRLSGSYSGQVGYRISAVRVGAAISGRMQITNYPSGPLPGRTQNQLELHSDFLSGPIRPGFEAKIPLGDWGQGLGTVVGASLTWIR